MPGYKPNHGLIAMSLAGPNRGFSLVLTVCELRAIFFDLSQFLKLFDCFLHKITLDKSK